MSRPTCGFTLIELLVVITIIVVLLALLAPALDQAIYQAELATCSARLHSTVQAVSVYAVSFHRSYPLREAVESVPGGEQPPALVESGFDYRPRLRPFVPINTLQCPLVDPANLETTLSNNVWSSYRFWWGWRFIAPAGESGMKKIGDRWSWTTQEDGRMRFRLLISDADTVAETAGLIYTSHPDKEGALQFVPFQDTPGFGLALPAGVGGAFTMNTYRGTVYRGPLDMNFGYDDGSTSRVTEITFDEVKIGGQANSERVSWVPEDNNSGRSTGAQPGDEYRTTVPRVGQ